MTTDRSSRGRGPNLALDGSPKGVPFMRNKLVLGAFVVVNGAFLRRVSILAIATTIAVSCARDGNDPHEALAIHRAEWARAIESLKAQSRTLQINLDGALLAKSTESGPSPGASAQMRAVLAGTRQALADIERHATQVEARIEPDVGKGAQAARVAVDAEDHRVRDQLRAMADQLAALRSDIPVRKPSKEHPDTGTATTGSSDRG